MSSLPPTAPSSHALTEPPRTPPPNEEEYGLPADTTTVPPPPDPANPPAAPPAPPNGRQRGPELSDIQRMVSWVRSHISAGRHTGGKLDCAAVIAARDAVLNNLQQQHTRIGIVSTWDGDGLPESSEENNKALVVAGVPATALEAARATYVRCVLRTTVVLARPTDLKVAISFLEKRARAEQAEQLSQLPAHKLTEEQRRMLYPVDALDDGDSEMLSCVVLPTEEEAEGLLERFPMLSAPLRQEFIRLCYCDVSAVQKLPRDEQKAAISEAMTPTQIEEAGGMAHLRAFRANELGLIIMRVLGRMETKKYEQAKGKDGSMAAHALGLRLVVYPRDFGDKVNAFPCAAWVCGFTALQQASGQVEIEAKK